MSRLPLPTEVALTQGRISTHGVPAAAECWCAILALYPRSWATTGGATAVTNPGGPASLHGWIGPLHPLQYQGLDR
jgi:hypothetical protein